MDECFLGETIDLFARMDTDKDGRVAADEMTATQPRVSGGKSGLGSAEKIRAVDTNGDGVLSAQEHRAGSKAMFARVDRNRDGRLSRGEYSAGHAKLLAKH